jgi:hypothetical protein
MPVRPTTMPTPKPASVMTGLIRRVLGSRSGVVYFSAQLGRQFP